jgi:hypothetical protein
VLISLWQTILRRPLDFTQISSQGIVLLANSWVLFSVVKAGMHDRHRSVVANTQLFTPFLKVSCVSRVSTFCSVRLLLAGLLGR